MRHKHSFTTGWDAEGEYQVCTHCRKKIRIKNMNGNNFLGTFKGAKIFGNPTAEACMKWQGEQIKMLEEKCINLEMKLLPKPKTLLERIFNY